MTLTWTDWGMKTETIGPGAFQHHYTGEMARINQADQFHAALVHPWAEVFDADDFDESELPFHAYFGDGTVIDVADLEEVRRAGRHCEVLFDWQPGDILVLDNILTMHGRKPYTGERKVLVSMG